MALPIASPRRRHALALHAVVLITAALLYVQRLGNAPLLEPDEGRYAEIPREMLATGDWVVPRLNGFVYAEKPPLVYWLTAITYRLTGVNEFGARLISALSAVATVAVTAWFGTRCFGPAAGWAAAAMLATTPLFFLFARLAILDVPLTLCMTLAIAALYRVREGGGRGWQVAAGLAMAAGVLTKGIVAVVLPVGIVAASALVERDRAAWRHAFSPLPIALALLLPLPWFWMMTERVPGFLDFFFVQHHLLRYTAGGKIGQHHRPGVLAAIYFAGALPWSLVHVAGIAREGRSTWRGPGRCADRFLDVWLLAVLGFFSLSSVQLATYVCPAFVPLALRAGRLWSDCRPRWPLLAWAALAALMLGLTAAPGDLWETVARSGVYDRWMHQAQALQSLLVVASAVVLGSTVLAGAIRRPAMALVIMAGGVAVGLASAEQARKAYRSYAALGTIVRLRAAEADRLVTYGTYLQGLPFYARRHTTLVSSLGELRFGATFPEGRALVWSDKRLIRAWNGRRRLFLIIEPEAWRRLRRRLERPPTVLALEHGRVLMTNAPLGIRPIARPGARLSARPPPPAAGERVS